MDVPVLDESIIHAVYQIVGARLTYGHRITMYGFLGLFRALQGLLGAPKRWAPDTKKSLGVSVNQHN